MDSNLEIPVGSGNFVLDLRAGEPLDHCLQLLFWQASCDSTFELLLRICFSSIVWFACASPPCGEFSTLKLREGQVQLQFDHGNILLGFLLCHRVNGQTLRLQSSLALPERCVTLLLAVFHHGNFFRWLILSWVYLQSWSRRAFIYCQSALF